MKQVNIQITNALPVTQTLYMQPVNIKGASNVVFDLIGVNEETNSVLFADIDWGDGSTVETIRRAPILNYKTKSIFNEVLYGKLGDSICTFREHIYNNTVNNTYGISLTATFTFFYNNGAITTIYQPLVVYWGSFYDEIKELVAINTQITPMSSSNTFVNLECQSNVSVIPTILP